MQGDNHIILTFLIFTHPFSHPFSHLLSPGICVLQGDRWLCECGGGRGDGGYKRGGDLDIEIFTRTDACHRRQGDTVMTEFKEMS